MHHPPLGSGHGVGQDLASGLAHLVRELIGQVAQMPFFALAIAAQVHVHELAGAAALGDDA